MVFRLVENTFASQKKKGEAMEIYSKMYCLKIAF